ncbi:HAMP domain-containing histidine kinase [Candidatus Parcubacteria bacterium]|nr:HAMP domain-containing histidine kinase [Candidatus Parcubacteria bacterium]
MLKDFFRKINFGFGECKENNLSLWQCPSFLFVAMGFINISSMIGIYVVVSKYNSPELIVASVSVVSLLIFIVGSSIIKGVEQIMMANKIKSEFVSIVSHQLKAPLTGMRWSSDVLISDKIGELNLKQNGYVKDIQENTSRMIRLVNDLLDVSKIESGKMEINFQDIDLKEIIEIVVKELKSFAKANNVELIVDINRETGKVKTDPIRIKMVVQNFIDNAIKYTNPEKGVVKVFLENRNENIYCSVSDNGLGISKADQARIFDKFFRGTGVAKKQTIGTGLGLYIAKAAIESSGGKIGFKSEKKKGSNFWFTLPLAKN